MPFSQYTRTSRRRTTEGTTSDIESINRQIENARRRIEDAGFSVEDADRRNIIERALNLPQGQNALFDILEIIQRPFQAVANPIHKSLRGEDQDVLQSALAGLSGRERVRGSDIAEDLGIENPVAKTIVGTALEIGLDPTTYIPGGVIAKGLKATAKGVGTAAGQGLNLAERAVPGLQRFREGTVQPLAERGREALGRIFVPDYQLEKNLFGETDETVKRLKQQTENRIAFMTEEAMKNVADAAKAAGGIERGTEVGRIMEAPLKQFDEAGNEIPRPQRELPTDPAVRQAAETLVRSNQQLRQWALENGVNIRDLEGYMTHVLTAEERKRRRNKAYIDRGNFGVGQPNKSILKERKLMGSAEDVNEQIGRNFFEPNAFFATAIGQKRLIEYVNAVNFRRQVLSNPNFAIKLEDYKAQFGDELPRNAVVIDTNNYKFINDETAKELGLAEEIGGQYVVTKAVKQALDRYKKMTDDEGINSFLKAFDAAQSAWKRLALFSIPFHIRNDLGAKFNNWVAGMSLPDITKYSLQADKEVYNAIIKGKESPMYREFREQGLGSTGLSGVEFARRGEEPEEAIRRTIEKRSQYDNTLKGRLKAEAKQLKNPLNAFETSRDFGQFIDQTNRYALYKWARDKGRSPEEAAKLVRTVQFDYSRLTPTEREVFTRIIPFYRWMRNNIPFQLRQFINDPRKYAQLNKLRLNLQESVGIDEENVPDWMKEQFALPVYGQEGKGKYLGLNLPVSDLTKLEDPLKTLVDAVTPIARLPAELALNRSFFFNKPIEEFEGQQKQYQLPILGTQFGIDQTLAYILEQLGGQIGRGLSGYLQRPEDVNQDIRYRLPTLGISSLLKDFDAEQSLKYQQLDQLRRLQDLIDFIEQQTGQRPRTVREIESGR